MPAPLYPLPYPKPTAFDGLPKLSFNGIAFPAENIDLHSQGRQHLHEFPHSPGAAPEKLGRGIWYLTVKTHFQVGVPGYPPDLWPTSMNQLASLYETQTTATLVHPTRGSFQAFISAWRENYNPKFRSGQRVDIEFLEDQRSNFLVQTAPSPSLTTLATSQQELDAALSLVKSQLNITKNDLSVFDAIRATVNAVQALSDTAGMYAGYLQSKSLELINLCSQADQLFSMQSPLVVGVLVQLRTIGAAASSISSASQSPAKIGKYRTPRTMTIQDIAIFLYGDVTRQSDLLTLNAAAIADPNSIPAGTLIQYFLPQSLPTQSN